MGQGWGGSQDIGSEELEQLGFRYMGASERGSARAGEQSRTGGSLQASRERELSGSNRRFHL